MLRLSRSEESVGAAHRAKLAYVYVRQSSPGQLRDHQESTTLQYRLIDRALALGWPRERVEVIDEDLGKSGASSHLRDGFQRLIAEVGLGHAGVVLSYDASRLARNNRDWHHLLELCSLFGVLLADSERLYDPGAYHDRLLLGLSGIMSEAELHQIRMRQHVAERQKAARGELRLHVPAGFIHAPDGCVMMDPDAQVQERIRLVFAKFIEIGSAQGVASYLRSRGLPLPRRPLRGPAPHALTWRDAEPQMVRQIIRNPAYAGAYVYGRKRAAPERRRPGVLAPTALVPMGQWEVCLKNAHPGYIGWEEYMSNVERLADNIGNFCAGRRGAPRRGAAMLQGIVICGICGHRMGLHYSGHGKTPVYHCIDSEQIGHCQNVRANQVDAEVERLLIEALQPDRIELALAAHDQMNGENRLLERQWALKREKAQYEAERARRQYDAVEPENRLVARSLETLWEEKMRDAERVEQDYARWHAEQVDALAAAERTRILAVAEQLPAFWKEAATDERKEMMRLVIDSVTIDKSREQGRIWFAILWQTGARTEHVIIRNTANYDDHAHFARIEEVVRTLNAAGSLDRQIVDALTAEGIMNNEGRPFTTTTVSQLRSRWSLPTVKINGSGPCPERWPDGSYSAQGAANAIGVTVLTVRNWLQRGIIKGRRLGPRLPWQLDLTDDDIITLQASKRPIGQPKRKAS